MRSLVVAAVLLSGSVSAHAEFSFYSTPSAGPQRTPVGLYQHPRPLPVARPPKAKPIAQGFGNDVPLNSALRQILPDGMHAQLEPAVDPNALVSWKGGRPWDVVLRAAVAPLGITVHLTNNGVLLSR